MATTDVEVLQINTQPSVKSLAALKKEIKDLKSQLLSLDQGTEEYNQTLSELGDKMHDLKEVNEQAAMTNTDFGTNLSNTSKALAGMSGAVQTVTGTLSLMGVQIGDDSKLLKTLVSAMAITQGIAAMEQGVKAVKALGLTIKAATAQQKLFNAAALKNPYLIAGAAILATITAIVAAIKSQQKAEDELHETRMKQIQDEIDEEMRLRMIRTNAEAELIKYQHEVINLTQEEIDKRKEALQEQINTDTELAKLYEDKITNLRETNNALVEEWKNLANSEKLTQENITRMAELRQQTIAMRQEAEDYRKKMEDITSTLELNNGKMNVLNKTVGRVGTTAVKSLKEIKDTVDAKDVYDALQKSYELCDELEELRGNIASTSNEDIKNNITKLQIAYQQLSDKLRENLDKIAQKYNKTINDITYEINIQKKTIEALPKDLAEAFLEWQKVDNIATSLAIEYEKMYTAEEERLRLSKETNIEAKHEMDMSDATVKNLEKQTELLRMEGAIQRENNSVVGQDFWNPSKKNNLNDIEYEAQQQQELANMKFQVTQEGLDREYEAQVAYYEKLSELYVNDSAKQLEITNTLAELDAQYQYNKLENEEELKNRSLEIAQEERDAKVALVNSYLDAYQSMSSAISGILGSIADTQEQGTRSWKNLKTAEAIINTLAGSVSAFMSGVNSGIPAPYNMILAATLATSTLAAGFAEVKKIQDTKVSKNSSSSSVRQATVQTINNNPSNVRTTNPQWNDEGQIENNITETNTTVTLVTSDLEALNSQNVNIQNNNQF